MIEGKGLGGKKIHRVNVSLTNKQAFKLNRLATACNMKPTTLAAVLIEKGLTMTGLSQSCKRSIAQKKLTE